jgi:multiple sugar transport system permease protein
MTTTAVPTANTAPGAAEFAPPRKSPWPAIGNIAAIVVIALWCLLPFYWMLVLSFRPNNQVFQGGFFFSNVTFDNYTYAFQEGNFGRALLNSLFIGAVVTIVGMVFGVFAAYAAARLQFRGKGVLLGAMLAASMFPQVALITPLFQLFTNIGWLGSYQAIIVPQIAFALPLSVYTLTSFFREMPWELEQAAKVDGATPFQAFRMVILPLAAPAMFTTAILVFLASWNDFLISVLMYSNKPELAPVTVAIARFSVGQNQQPFAQPMAAGVIVTIPLVIIVLLFQRRIVSGLTAGGVKG